MIVPCKSPSISRCKAIIFLSFREINAKPSFGSSHVCSLKASRSEELSNLICNLPLKSNTAPSFSTL